MAKDFKSSENLSKLLNLLQDVKDKELLDTTIDDLVTKTPRTSKTTGELFKTVGKATGESYGAGYKPNFVLSSGDEMLPAVIKGASSNQVVPVKNMAKDVVGEAVEVGARNLPTLAKNTLPSVGKQVAKNVAKGVGTAGLAAVGALLDETSTEAPGYNTPEIQQLIKETNLSKLPPEALANLENILAGQPQEVQKEVMSRMTPEQLASIQNTPPEAQNEADSLSKQISDATPQKVQEQLKKAPSAPKDPYAEIKAQLEALQKGSADELKSARSKDAILGFLNNLNKGLSRYDQAAASTGSRQAQQVMEVLQVNPQFAAQAKEDQTSQYKALMDKLGIQKDALSEEYKKAQIEALTNKSKEGYMTPLQQAQLELSKQRLNETQEDRMRKAQQFKESLDDRQQEQLDRKVSDISKRMEKSGLIERSRAMKEIESFLEADYGTSLDNPKSVDIGGIGLGASFRPDFLTSDKDISFRQNVQGLANQLLKNRSGAAVTDQEYSRFLKEIGSGNFSSEKDLFNGLRKMRDDIKSQTSNIVNNYGDDITKEYINRIEPDLYTNTKTVTPDSPKSEYNPAQEAGIKNVMDRNGVDRNTAINALKKAGKL